jgi:eukaryotic-like serine/threonine-protein kinase
MFAVIQPGSQTMPRGQLNRLLKESDPSSWFSTDVTFVVGPSTTHISAKSPGQPNQGGDLHSKAAAVLESVLHPGIRFGPFRLIRRLGRGAQGDVWKARRHEPYLDIVALKVLSPALARQPHRLAQFRREAERGTRLVGPSLLQVFEFGEIDGFPYMAMPFVEGTTLQQVIRRRQTYLKGEAVDLVHRLISMEEELYLPTAARVMSKAARALGLVHACHVAHRDVKPANILLDGHRACGVYLCDLGLGRDLEIATSEQMRDGAGTPMYMAPERLLKAPANEILCDLYSLGVTLFETFTLGRPFDPPGELPLACLSAKLASTKPKEPRKLKPDLPADLEAIILKAMARNPRDRHQSAQEVAGELDQFLVRRYSRAGRIIADHAKAGGPSAHIVMVPPRPAARMIAGRCPL